MALNFSMKSLLAASFIYSSLAAAVSVPNCQSTAPQQKTLSNVRTTLVNVSGNPFGLTYASHEDIAFATLGNKLGVFNASAFAPSLIHQIPLPQEYVSYEGALGITLTHDGQNLFLAADVGAIVVDVKRAIAGSSDAVIGVLNGTTSTQYPGNASVEVRLSKDDRYAFVSQEYGPILGATPGNVDVFELEQPTCNGSMYGTPVGYIDLGIAVVGTALSPDGLTLYATSQAQSFSNTSQGTLGVLDVKTLESYPSKALKSHVVSGCGPVRTIVSSDGKTVWVTARESNHLLAFDAAKLDNDPGKALLASVQVGTSPVGLTFARSETRILTADSNRFNYANTTTGLSVIDVEAVLAGSGQAVLGRIPTGLFPREFAVSRDGRTILVANYDSKQIQAVDVATLP